MSSRVLKKLQGADDLGVPKPDDDQSEPDSQIVIGGSRKVNINPYDMVIVLFFTESIFKQYNLILSKTQFIEQSMSESEVKEDDNETEHASTAANTRTEQAKKKKKKRKKKGTKQQQSAGQRRSSEDKSDVRKSILLLLFKTNSTICFLDGRDYSIAERG